MLQARERYKQQRERGRQAIESERVSAQARETDGGGASTVEGGGTVESLEKADNMDGDETPGTTAAPATSTAAAATR